MKPTDNQQKKEKRGLYFALAVCLVAVGIAAWGTYNSVSDYVASNKVVKNNTLAQKEEDPGTSRAAQQQLPTDTKPSAPPAEESSEAPAEGPEEPEEPAEEPALQDVDAPAYALRDSFVPPVAGSEITAAFSGKELVYNETMKDYRTHNGQDIAAQKGQTVYAANNGVVSKVYNDLLLGNVIIVEHGDYNFWYCGLGDTFLVKEGDIVTSAKPIGSVTTVPSETGNTHLHLQVEKDGVFIDPADLPFA